MSLFQSSSVVVARDVDGSAVLTLDVPGHKVNVFNRQVLADLDAALDAVRAAPGIAALVVVSGKKSGFLAGADLHEFLAIRDPAGAIALSRQGQELFAKLAGLPMPTVAVVHGPCLGGGLEFALACDYRLVLDKPNTQLGLPEIELGLLPGWGGTQRLPRVVGLERALQLILTPRKRLDARQALRWGLADALAANTEADFRTQLDRIKGRAVIAGKRQQNGLPLRTWRQRLLESNPLGRRVVFTMTQRMLARKVPDDMPAPREAFAAVRTGSTRGLTAGLAAEREAASRLALTPACHNLIGLFFQGEAARRLPAELARAGAAPVRRVGVVGAGTMGAGITQLAALKGADVVVREINQAALDAGLARIDGLFAKAVARGLLSADEAQQRRAAVRGTLNGDEFDDVDVVVEAAVEDLEAKRAVFRDLAGRTRPTTVLATNTSSLLVASLQEGLPHPERVAGLHFFNPVHKMPLVEVVRAPATAEGPLATLTQWAIDLGKTPVVVRDGPGFVVNRILMPYLNEAVLLLAEGMSIGQVDRAMRRFGMPVGPLQLLDEIGLDVAAHVAHSMAPALAGRFEPNDAFERLRSRGWLGTKSGRGFYVHKGKSPRPNAEAETLLRDADVASSWMHGLPPSARLHDARERMVLLMVNEAARVLGEGLAAADDIDLAMVYGTGWAPHRGGPLRYADQRGPAAVVEALTGLAARHGPRFEPCAELRRRAGSGAPFRVSVVAAVPAP